MKTKFVAGLVIFALITSMGIGIAHNEGDSGTAYPGIPFISDGGVPDAGVRYGLGSINQTIENGTAYAGRPFISPYIY